MNTTRTALGIAVLAAALAAPTSSCSALSTRSIRAADATVTYTVRLAAPQTQHVEIALTLPTDGDAETVVMLPAWRPGRYEILDPAGTVRDVRAADGDGAALAIAKRDKATWVVDSEGASEVTVTYTVYANSLGDRTRHVDPTHAFLSGSSVFLYSPRLRSAPVRVELEMPDDWGIAGGLELADGETSVLVADDYDVLVDSPLELGLHDRIEFDVDGVPHEIVIWPQGVERDDERMIEDVAKVVREHVAVFGRMPYSRYVFLVHAGPGGGGTEHLNSTIMQTSREAIEGSLDNSSSYQSFLGLVSHEFFHTWNVKQLRPAGIHPYDYQNENYTDLFWVSEGTTSYYGGLTLVRAGLRKEKKLLDSLAGSIGRQRRSPGNKVQSLAESSFDAWIKFNARDTDSENSQVSFYGKGLLASLLIDAEVRARTDGRVTLDDVLRVMFERFPLEGPGFTTADLRGVLGELTGSSFDAFFASYIEGTERYPFEQALLALGLELRFEPTPPDDEDDADADDEEEAEEADAAAPIEPRMKAYAGLRLASGGSGATVRTVYTDGPAFDAGVLQGDELLTLNGRRVRASDLDARLKRLAPGDTVRLHLLRHDELVVLDFALTGIPDGKWTLKRVKEPTDAQRAAFTSWCGVEWKPATTDGDEAATDSE